MGLSNYEGHKRAELVSFDDIDYDDFDAVQKARSAMGKEQWIKAFELKVTHDALKKCRKYHEVDAQRNCRPLVLKYMKMIEKNELNGYLGYQKNDPTK